MIYSFLSLQTVGLLVAALLIASHLIAVINPKAVQEWLWKFPRSKEGAFVLLTLAAAWFFTLIYNIDLGEFTKFRNIILGVIALGYVLTLFFVTDFLAVRSLGMLFLLMAEPLLEVTFQRPEISRLLLTALAYAWVVMGIFWVGKPYLLRDQIDWVSKTNLRWRIAAFGGVAYGVVLLVAALFLYGG